MFKKLKEQLKMQGDLINAIVETVKELRTRVNELEEQNKPNQYFNGGN